jgi:hypothetical protein
MIDQPDNIEKKQWKAPEFLELNFNQTLGGTSRDTGEGAYLDPVS